VGVRRQVVFDAAQRGRTAGNSLQSSLPPNRGKECVHGKSGLSQAALWKQHTGFKSGGWLAKKSRKQTMTGAALNHILAFALFLGAWCSVDVRLVDAAGSLSNVGLLQVRTDAGFGTVCGANAAAADVTCPARCALCTPADRIPLTGLEREALERLCGSVDA